MPDLDAELRALAVALMDESPAVPPFDELLTMVLEPSRPPTRRARILVAAGVLVAVVVTVIAALALSSGPSRI